MANLGSAHQDDEYYLYIIDEDATLESELSNTTTSSSSDIVAEEDYTNEESGEESGERRKAAGQKRSRKSAELAKKRLKRGDRIGRSGSNGDSTGSSNEIAISRESSCEKNDCQSDDRCAVGISANCTSEKVTFFHISRREHVCQNCYEEFRVGKAMFDRYIDWKRRWVAESRCVPTLRMFIFEQLLPFWLNCSECGKFRRISRTIGSGLSQALLARFKCSYAFSTDVANPCSIPEESDVFQVRGSPSLFIKSLNAPPLLQHSPAAHFLADHYYYDELGISPMKANFEVEEGSRSTGDFMCPFNIPNEQSKAFSLRPDVLEYDEVYAFPEFSVEQMLYLAMRNLIVALWNLNPFEYLDHRKCLSHLICPGLARVWYSIELRRVIDYLSLKNVINYGILPIPRETLLSRKKVPRLEVIVVGGGISGLGATRQLRSLGAKVTLLEAKAKLGGRMQDDWSLGVAVGCGAQLVTGIVNNPVVLMCEQISLAYRLLSDECPLIDAQTGRLVSPMADRVVDEHFNCLLDILGHWKQDEKAPDVSLLSLIGELHEKLLKHIDFAWAKVFERLFHWQVGNVEFSCGARLDQVSAKHWDQNESVGQFAGAHALLADGSGELIKQLAEGTDVRCGHQVLEIDYSMPGKAKLFVKCANGKVFTGDKVLLCVPLTQYQRERIKFVPELPERKRLAYRSLGSGLIEKVAVRFPRRFWVKLLKSDGTIDYFGHVAKSTSDRALFNMFYDFSTRVIEPIKDSGSPRKQQQHFVLMSYVCADSVDVVNRMSDVEVVEQFVDILQDLFPEENIPAPLGYVVTHWGRDPHIGMSYSFVKLGASGEDYDNLGCSLDGVLYFAGECTNRFFPQTMTGAYVSALRESSKMVEDWLLFNS